MADQVQELLTVGARTERRAVNAGRRHADRLLRALVPLYLLRKTHGPLPLSGADLGRFWGVRGVHFTGGNARGALWRWFGYARHTVSRVSGAQGWVITPNGIRYVEQAIAHGARR